MEGDNIVHVIDAVMLPKGYDNYEDFYDSVTKTSVMEKLLQKTGEFWCS